jgi:hypothetical protein
MRANPSRSGTPQLHTGPYDPRRHRPGTKGSAGRCSWTEGCTGRPMHTVAAEYPSGQRFTWAVCASHHPDALACGDPTG